MDDRSTFIKQFHESITENIVSELDSTNNFFGYFKDWEVSGFDLDQSTKTCNVDKDHDVNQDIYNRKLNSEDQIGCAVSQCKVQLNNVFKELPNVKKVCFLSNNQGNNVLDLEHQKQVAENPFLLVHNQDQDNVNLQNQDYRYVNLVGGGRMDYPFDVMHQGGDIMFTNEGTLHHAQPIGDLVYEHKNCETRVGETTSQNHLKTRNHKKTYACKLLRVCGAKFCSLSKLKLHQSLSAKHSNDKNTKKPFVCVKCGKRFTNKLALKNHQRNVHVEKKTCTGTLKVTVTQTDKLPKYSANQSISRSVTVVNNYKRKRGGRRKKKTVATSKSTSIKPPESEDDVISSLRYVKAIKRSADVSSFEPINATSQRSWKGENKNHKPSKKRRKNKIVLSSKIAPNHQSEAGVPLESTMDENNKLKSRFYYRQRQRERRRKTVTSSNFTSIKLPEDEVIPSLLQIKTELSTVLPTSLESINTTAQKSVKKSESKTLQNTEVFKLHSTVDFTLDEYSGFENEATTGNEIVQLCTHNKMNRIENCFVCGKTVKTVLMEAHMLTHTTDEKPYEYTESNVSFSEQRTMQYYNDTLRMQYANILGQTQANLAYSTYYDFLY